MTGYLLIWAIGVVAVLAGSTALIWLPLDLALNWRESTTIVAAALLWPLVLAVVVAGMAFDLARFLIAVVRKPH